MATAFRASGQVLNSTAGTSVVVPQPAGTANGDALVAFIARAAASTITPPAGWTLIAEVTSGGVRMTAYWKVASTEAASWTWTLGTSARNWGVVAAYTGAHPTAPFTASGSDNTLASSTILQPSTASLPDGGQGVSAAAATRTASGSATTWTHSSTERNDLSTNAGSGTDICGVVGDSMNSSLADSTYGPTLTASQSQTDGVAISVTLNPYFVPLNPGSPLAVVVEAAFGADPDSDLSGVTWTDISSAVRAGVRLRKGVLNENGQSDPTRVEFELNNPTGKFTPDNPTSIYWPNVALDLPIRVSIAGIGVRTYERATAFVDSWAPSWDDGPSWSVVTVSCGGRLQRSQEGRPPIKSPAYRKVVGNDPPPLDYWPLEDEATASAGANAMGGLPAGVSGGATFGGDAILRGSPGVVSLPGGAKVVGTARQYAATGQWWVAAALKLPVPVTVTTTLIEVFGSGTARRWRVVLVPGSPDQFRVRAFDSSETQILDAGAVIGPNPSEADIYGHWILVCLGATQNGADIDYQSWLLADRVGVGTGQNGTLSSQTHGNVRWSSVTATVEQDGMGVGHLTTIVDPTFDTFSDPPISMADIVRAGNSGETHWARFLRLCREEGVPANIEQADTDVFDRDRDTMSPQQPGSLVQTLRDIEGVDAGVLHDGGPLGELVLSQRSVRYNRPVAINLTGGQLMKGFSPRFDNAIRKGEVIASRPDGASYRFTPAGQEGRYQDSITVHVENDSQLPHVASWRSARGQQRGMRYPAFGIDLRAHPELAKTWLASGISTRVNLTALPSQHPATTVDLFIDGYAEELDVDRWVVNPINCSPARVQGEVFQIESAVGNRGRLDSGATERQGTPIDATQTAITFTITAGPFWVTGAVNFDIEVDGERMTVTNIAAPSGQTQLFTVVRGVGGTIARAHAVGSAVRLWNGPVLAL